MGSELLYFSAFVTGLMGSIHCAGMCGGIASALGVGLKHPNYGNTSLLALFYQIGRISSYTLAGFLLGSFGAVISKLPGLESIALYLRFISALFLICLGFYLAGFFSYFAKVEKIGLPVWKKLSPLTKKIVPINTIYKASALGMLWGWLPCGLTYTILLWTVTTQSGFSGALIMLCFGLGTIPMMLLMTLGFSSFKNFLQKAEIRTLAGLILVAFGLYLIVNLYQMKHHQTIQNNGHEHVHHPKTNQYK